VVFSNAAQAVLPALVPPELLARASHARPAPARQAGQPKVTIRGQISEGLRWLFRHRLLRVVAVLLGVLNFANQMGQAVLVLLAT
jgi:hypothetical protein